MLYYRLRESVPFERRVFCGLSLNKKDWTPSYKGKVDFGKFSAFVESMVDNPPKPDELMPVVTISLPKEETKKRGRKKTVD